MMRRAGPRGPLSSGDSGALACITTDRAPSSPVGRQVLILPLFLFFAFLLFLCLEETEISNSLEKPSQ